MIYNLIMCFSAPASFLSGAILFLGWLYTLKKTSRSQYIPLANIPLLFWIQQISEGFVWLGLNWILTQELQLWTYIFLFFSQILRPTIVPIAIYMIETVQKRRKIIVALWILGVCISVYMAYCLLSYGASASILGHHISYLFSLPHVSSITIGTLYVGATVGAIASSSDRLIQTRGFMLFVSVAITLIYYNYFFVSVRCFFAALLSIYIFHIIHSLSKNDSTQETIANIQ